jgi:hypothetical protein
MSDEKSPASGIPLPTRVIVSFKAGAVLAIANIICVAILSVAWTKSHAEPKAINVTGSAKRAIDSDLIVWTAHVSASDPSLEGAFTALKSSMDKTTKYLADQGLSGTKVEIGSISTVKHHERDGKGNETDKITLYELSQSITVTDTDIAKVSDVSRSATDLIQQGVMLQSEAPTYIYTKMADLKISMLAEATADATARATQIASNSGGKIGSIIDARMGVMQINALHSNDATGSGVNDTSSRQKEITAVVSARFSLQ